MLPVGLSAAELRGIARPLPKAQRVATAASDVELWYTPFETAGARGDKAFNRIDGPLLGIKRLPLPRPYQTMQPGPMHMGALAAGDGNRDGRPGPPVRTPPPGAGGEAHAGGGAPPGARPARGGRGAGRQPAPGPPARRHRRAGR